MRIQLFLAAVILSIGGVNALAQTLPTTQPLDPRIKSLIVQLGDDDPHQRDAAADALRKLGKQAMSGLQVATADTNPQIRLSAEALVAEQRERENPTRRPPVATNLPDMQSGIILNGGGNIVLNGVRINNLQGQVQFRMNVVGGGQQVRDVTHSENGYKVHVHEDNDGVKMEVTDNGQTKTYAAKNAAELKEKEPEGYKVYEKYMNNGAGQMKIQIAPK